MPRESAEDKIARIVNDAISARDRKSQEEKDPNKQWMRQAIREELENVLGGILNDKGDASRSRSSRRRDDDDDEGEGGGIFSLFGG
jgi:hypothetical protein